MKIPLVDLKANYLSIKQEIDFAIQKVIDNSSFIMGKEVEDFDKNFADFINAKYSMGVGNGTFALHLALITFAVQNEAKIVAEAMSENTKKMNAVIDSIKKQGVESKDLKTASFSISPRYEWREKESCLIFPCPQGERILAGYDVYQSLQVKIRNLEKVGLIIQGASDMGANDVSGLQFTVENEDELKSQARKQAIDEAMAKAKELASQLGVDLVRIINFSESGAWPVPYFSLGMEKAAVGGETPQIETGENKISLSVTITYEIH